MGRNAPNGTNLPVGGEKSSLAGAGEAPFPTEAGVCTPATFLRLLLAFGVPSSPSRPRFGHPATLVKLMCDADSCIVEDAGAPSPVASPSGGSEPSAGAAAGATEGGDGAG